MNKKDKINLVCTSTNLYDFYGIKGLSGLYPVYNRTLFPNSYLRLFGRVDNPLIPTISRNYSKLDVNFDKKDDNFNPDTIEKHKIDFKTIGTQTEYSCLHSYFTKSNMDDSDWVVIKEEEN